MNTTGPNKIEKEFKVLMSDFNNNPKGTPFGNEVLSTNVVWEQIEIPENTKGNLKVKIFASNNDTLTPLDQNNCKSAIGVTISFQNESPTYIDSKNLKRTDKNGNELNLFFPTTIAPIVAKEKTTSGADIRNPFNTKKLGEWYLEFQVPIVLPKDYKVEDILLSVQDSKKVYLKDLFQLGSVPDKIERINNLYQVTTLSREERGASAIVTKNVIVKIDSIEKSVHWLNIAKEIDEVNFRFEAVYTDANGKYFKTNGGAKVSQYPLYNVVDNSLIKCRKSGPGALSMYARLKSFKLLKKISDIFTGSNRLVCNDISLPFGGYYYLHEEHRRGMDIDFLYPSSNPLDKINLDPVHRKKQVDIVANPQSKELARNAAIAELTNWVESTRIGLNKMLSVDEILPEIEKYYSTGENKAPIDSYAWHVNLLFESKIEQLDGIFFKLDVKTKVEDEIKDKRVNVPGHLNHIHIRVRER